MATLTTTPGQTGVVEDSRQHQPGELSEASFRDLREASSGGPVRSPSSGTHAQDPGLAGMLADAIVKEMLQAQIDIVDEAGHTEESMTILGSGQVSLGPRQTGGYLHADEAATDLAVIVQEDARVSINVKMANALERDHAFITPGSVHLASTRDAMVAFIEQARRYVKVKQIIVNGHLLSGSAVIYSGPSSLVRRAQASAALGAIEVTKELQELRDQGKIDEHGNILVPWPDDMKPGSSSDL